MKYMGSKNRIAKYILPIMLKDRQPEQWFVCPFVGGGNLIDKVDGNRLGSDINPYVIAALKLIRDNPESLPNLVTEDDYKNAKELEDVGLKGYIGFAMSFGGKWFGGYRRDKRGQEGNMENMQTQSRRSKSSAVKQSPKLKGVVFVNKSYDELKLPPNSIVYCDIPYKQTTTYKDKFDYEKFYEWVRKVSKNHKVYISEYEMPNDFQCIWQKEISNTLSADTDGTKPVEKLFTYAQ